MKSPKPTGNLQAAPANKGRFLRGASGNPAGRPAGSRNRATVVARELLEDGAAACVGQLVAMAKAGDRVALRLVVERLVPRAGREVREPFADLSLERAGDVAGGMSAVIRAAADGRISLDEAREFARLLDLERRAIETDELRVRLEALERMEGLGHEVD